METLLAVLEHTDGLRPPSGTESPPANGVYHRETLVRNDEYEVATFNFPEGTSSTLHGHSEAAVLIRVNDGVLMEEAYIPVLSGGRISDCSAFLSENTGAERCEFRYCVRTLRRGETGYLPVGSYHRVHCINRAPTINVYMPISTNPVAPVPEYVMPALLSAKRIYMQNYMQISTAPLLVGRGVNKSIVPIVDAYIDRWAEREAAQNAAKSIHVHPDTIQDLRDTQILAAPIPIEYGGFGESLATVSRAIRTLAQRAPCTALAIAMPLGNAAATTIPTFGVKEELREELMKNTMWLVRVVCQERKILAVANSEPGSGGELSRTKTEAHWDETQKRYVLSGRKSFATLGPDADYFMCAARRVGPQQKGYDEGCVDGFFVPKENVKLDEKWDPLGMRPTASVGMTLENSASECMLGFHGSLEGVNARHWSTLLFTSVFVGVAEGALQTLVALLDPATKQSSYIRCTVGQLALQIDAAAGYLEGLAAGATVMPYPPEEKARCNNAKSFAAKVAVDTAVHVSQMAGGKAYQANHAVSQLLHDALAAPLLRPPFPKVIDFIADKLIDKA